MGFDLHIVIILVLDETSGKPVPYNECIIPEKYRKFIHQRGSWFSDYIYPFDGCIVSSEAFLDAYPPWQDIPNFYEWTEKDHDAFKEALEWFTQQKIFNVMWSY